MTAPIYVTLTPRDPLIARDGRPFAEGLRMRAVDWIYPSVVAGSLRTLLGEGNGGFGGSPAQYAAMVVALKAIEIAGPFPTIGDQLCVPAPLDAMAERRGVGSGSQLCIHPARPWDLKAEGGGCDFLPDYGMHPVTLPDEAAVAKPEPLPAFWSIDAIARWLLDGADRPGRVLSPDWPDGFYRAAAVDRRVHVKMDAESGVGEDGMLFATTGLDLTRLGLAATSRPWWQQPEVSLAVRMRDAAGWNLAGRSEWSPIGGERRLAHWQVGATDRASIWVAPPSVRGALMGTGVHSSRYVRMQLATPAIFSGGWCPGWLSHQAGQLKGEVPGTGVKVRLVGATTGRWKPISGWSYEPIPSTVPGRPSRPGPKAVRRMAPAGSVYFFRVEDGDPSRLADRWLESVCEDGQDRRDGFGLALWGIWSPMKPTHTFESNT